MNDIPIPQRPKRYTNWVLTILIFLCFTLLITTIGFISYINIESGQYCKALIRHGDRALLYDLIKNKTVVENTKLNGIYSPVSNIYCMYNNTKESFSKTTSHEYCHFLIDEGMCINNGQEVSCKEHFCGG